VPDIAGYDQLLTRNLGQQWRPGPPRGR